MTYIIFLKLLVLVTLINSVMFYYSFGINHMLWIIQTHMLLLSDIEIITIYLFEHSICAVTK